jgi:hypothetical protein
VTTLYSPFGYWTQDALLQAASSCDLNKYPFDPKWGYKAGTDARYTVSHHGMSLGGFEQLANCFISPKWTSTAIHAGDVDANRFRQTAREQLQSGRGIIVNILRSWMGEQGGGHFSPVVDYHEGRLKKVFLVG